LNQSTEDWPIAGRRSGSSDTSRLFDRLHSQLPISRPTRSRRQRERHWRETKVAVEAQEWSIFR
jgi:hypothetical protein